MVETLCPCLTLAVPAQAGYLLVIRAALGGLAVVSDLDVDTLDDLRQAVDEACDYLLHQGVRGETISLEAWQEGKSLRLKLRLNAFQDAPGGAPEELALSRAVLETLLSEVTLHQSPMGLVDCVEMTVRRQAG